MNETPSDGRRPDSPGSRRREPATSVMPTRLSSAGAETPHITRDSMRAETLTHLE